MIHMENLTKVFRTGIVETTAIRNLCLEIPPGDFVAIMGPSGSGKSTLLNLIGLLDRPSSGDYRLSDHLVSGMSERRLAPIRKQYLGFVFQSFNLIDDLTVAQNVEMPLAYRRLSRSARRARVEEMLARVGLEHRARHRPPELSGGQQQRVAIARALVTKPQLILADEPTGNLDSKNGRQIMALLADLHREGTTIVMVTHSARHARYAQRVIHLLDGEVAEGSHV